MLSQFGEKLMSTEMKRRIFLKRSLTASAVGVAAGAGLLAPQQILAAWNKTAFEAKEVPNALNALLGASTTEPSEAIKIKAPDIAENGAVVPITVETDLADVESIAIIASENPVPLVANFNLGKNAEGFVSTRIKMGKTGDVIGVVKSGGKLYSAKKGVKVTIGGCGG
jgi:sulfur-oxidizing protein SoxY